MKKLEKMLALTWHALEKKQVIVRIREGHKMYVKKPREWIKNHGLRKNGTFLLCLDLYYVKKRGISCTIRVFFLKERLFLLSYQLSTLFSPISPWVLTLKIQLHVPFIIWRIWLSTRTSVKLSFSYLGYFHNCEVICWLEDRNCANVALGPVGRWLCHCLGNKFLDIERDIRSTVIDTCVSEMVQHAFNQ